MLVHINMHCGVQECEKDIPRELLSLFTCKSCTKYLSVLPVQEFSDGTYLCGRCNSDKNTQCHTYEKFSKYFQFPCIYSFFGCLEKVTPSFGTTHEQNCKYAAFYCPIDDCMKICPMNSAHHFNKFHEEITVSNAFVPYLKTSDRFNKRIITVNDTCYVLFERFENYNYYLAISSINCTRYNKFNLILSNGDKIVIKENISFIRHAVVLTDISEALCVDVLKLINVDSFENIKCEISYSSNKIEEQVSIGSQCLPDKGIQIHSEESNEDDEETKRNDRPLKNDNIDNEMKRKLIVAAKYNDLQKVILYINLGSDLTTKDGSGYSALHWAVYNNNKECVQKLLLAGSDCNLQDKNGDTPLTLASYYNHASCMEMLIDNGNTDLNIANNKGWTALLYASYYNHLKCLTLLINAGCNCNIQNYNGYGYTALHYSCYYNHDACLIKLIEAGADLNIGDSEGNTPLHIACRYGYKEFMLILMKAGANVNIINNSGKTPMER